MPQDHPTSLPQPQDAAEPLPSEPSLRETRDKWDELAEGWRTQVGGDGDRNRMLNSDPVLWRMAGEVAGRRVLDAGCGTGYLTRQLADRGAQATGVDFSPRMIEIARADHPGVDFRVDSVESLATCADGSFDLLLSNYVLMDTPNLEAALRAFLRVLAPGAAAVAIFSHPCFPAGRCTPGKGDAVSYFFPQSYFERTRFVDPPWSHFTSEFVWFHRPLADYFRAFTEAGFAVEALEEPHLLPDRYHLARDEKERRKHATRSYSIAFKLRKPNL